MDRWWDKPDITSLCGCFSSFGNRGGQSDTRARPVPPVPCLWPRHCTCVHLFHIGPVQLISFAESVKPPVIIGSYKSPSTGILHVGHKLWCFLSSHQSSPVTSSKCFPEIPNIFFFVSPITDSYTSSYTGSYTSLLPSSSSHNYDAIGPAVTSNCEMETMYIQFQTLRPQKKKTTVQWWHIIDSNMSISGWINKYLNINASKKRSSFRQTEVKNDDFIKREMTSAWCI